MPCPKCEDICGQLENAFKNHFFSCLHIDPEKPSQSTSEQVNVQLTGSKLDEWLYRFCLCFVFRVMLVAANGCFNLQGNFDQLYDLFIVSLVMSSWKFTMQTILECGKGLHFSAFHFYFISCKSIRTELAVITYNINYLLGRCDLQSTGDISLVINVTLNDSKFNFWHPSQVLSKLYNYSFIIMFQQF